MPCLTAQACAASRWAAADQEGGRMPFPGWVDHLLPWVDPFTPTSNPGSQN